MGVFKWLRRERVTVTTRRSITPPSRHSSSDQVTETYHNGETQAGTIRTEKYKRDLAEFQARRSSGTKEELAEFQVKRSSGTKEELEEFQVKRSSGTKEELAVTPEKLKRCGRHNLPAACIDCTPDDSFNYEKRSACKYKKNKRSRSNTPEKANQGLPNIQFLFQNQVFMPGNYQSYSEPRKAKSYHYRRSRSPDFPAQKQLDFKENELDFDQSFKKERAVHLPIDIKSFLGNGSSDDNVDGLQATGEVYGSSHEVNVDNNSSHEVNVDNNSADKLMEAMAELKQLDQWADEQLMPKSPATSRSDDSKSDTSTHGLPVVSSRHLDINIDKGKIWNHGMWGVVPVQIKKLTGVNIDSIRKKQNAEINILRKCRHPNIILLMGIYPEIDNNVHIICERCVDSLFGILHVQGRILSAQTSVKYALDIANALVFLRMHDIMHTQLNSMSIMITSHDTAKLADLGPCAINKKPKDSDVPKDYEEYSAEPRYVNLDDTHSKTSDSEPLLSKNPSEVYLKTHAVSKPYEDFINSELYRWQAPELFVPDEMGMVQPCSKSDAYSLSLILWESCNASIPWKLLTYDKLKEQYTLWETGMSLPQDGTYPGGLLALLQSGLKLKRSERIDLETLQENLQTVKRDLDDIGYIMIPARLKQRTKSNFSTSVWDNVSPTDSECQSPQNIEHQAVVHNNKDAEDSSSLTETSDKDTKSDTPFYESIKKTYPTHSLAQKCRIPEYNDKTDSSAFKISNCYELLPENDFSSACSTPIAKLRARIKDLDTPGSLHRSDSTEYCSILSPNRTAMLAANDDSNKDISYERAPAKLSRSFTPKSYKPLHIKVPDCKLDSIKPLLRDQNGIEKSSYNFDIQNYSLPSTPIARSNKLRKNAWLSGDFGKSEKTVQPKEINFTQNITSLNQNFNIPPESPETQPKSSSCSPEVQVEVLEKSFVYQDGDVSPASIESVEGVLGSKRRDPSPYYSSETNATSERTFDLKLPMNKNHPKYKVDEDVLANMSVKPLVAIHERWIYEANKKSGRSMSLPEANSFVSQISALKPASHCVDTLQKSLPQLNARRSNKTFRTPASPNSNGGNWEQFCQARDTISKELNLSRESERYRTSSKDLNRATSTEETNKIDQATDTSGIEEFIRDLIRKEFQHLLHEIDDTSTVTSQRNEELLAKGVANILESLNYDDHDKTIKKDLPKTFSRVKINGNNKPLLQITFNRSGENSLQVLDNCVNVTICDGGKEPVVTHKLNESLEETLTEDLPVYALKRCQAFNAIQEAKSTEDLYIDDDLSTHMNENFGGKVKLIPLHGSLHEILCEREDECCLIKVKQENGCDTIYFRCDNSDTEGRDAIDGCERDTVVYKRSISLIEERIQRIIPKDKRAHISSQVKKDVRPRPKSEVFAPIVQETRVLSASTPSLATHDNEVELNIENVISYQDSSSDECLICKSPENDDFEVLEKEIEQEVKISTFAAGLGYMDKISEENLAALCNEDADKD